MSPRPNKSGMSPASRIHDRNIAPVLWRRALLRIAVQLAWVCVVLALVLSLLNVAAAEPLKSLAQADPIDIAEANRGQFHIVGHRASDNGLVYTKSVMVDQLG